MTLLVAMYILSAMKKSLSGRGVSLDSERGGSVLRAELTCPEVAAIYKVADKLDLPTVIRRAENDARSFSLIEAQLRAFGLPVDVVRNAAWRPSDDR